jgi:hypothetical protein
VKCERAGANSTHLAAAACETAQRQSAAAERAKERRRGAAQDVRAAHDPAQRPSLAALAVLAAQAEVPVLLPAAAEVVEAEGAAERRPLLHLLAAAAAGWVRLRARAVHARGGKARRAHLLVAAAAAVEEPRVRRARAERAPEKGRPCELPVARCAHDDARRNSPGARLRVGPAEAAAAEVRRSAGQSVSSGDARRGAL